MLRKRSPHSEIPSQEQKKRRRERVLIIISLILVVAITSLEVNLVHRGGQFIGRRDDGRWPVQL